MTVQWEQIRRHVVWCGPALPQIVCRRSVQPHKLIYRLLGLSPERAAGPPPARCSSPHLPLPFTMTCRQEKLIFSIDPQTVYLRSIRGRLSHPVDLQSGVVGGDYATVTQ